MKRVNSYIVAIPAYNEEFSILATLESVLEASNNTPHTLKRIIVCVNGCTDNTEAVVRKWNKAPVAVIKSQSGYVNAMNRILAHAKKYYAKDALIKADADCMLDPLAIKYLTEQLNTHENLAVAGGHPYPAPSKNLSLYKRFMGKAFSVRSRVPLAEVATHNVKKYHPYAATDPLPGIGRREERLKIYFHGRLWCLRRPGMIPLLPSEVIGEDLYIARWLNRRYGYDCIRLDYRARVYFKPNDSLVRHWKVYRRIYEDNIRACAMDELKEHSKNSSVMLDWEYILRHAPKRELIYFAVYALISKAEKKSFTWIKYRDSFWQYQEKEA